MLAPEADVGSRVNAARAKFTAARERAHALSPRPLEDSISRPGPRGSMHTGPRPGGEPVVLLTGAGCKTSGWHPHVAGMADKQARKFSTTDWRLAP